MTEQDKEYYDALLEMFTNSKGWKFFQEDIKKFLDAAAVWENLNDANEFFVRKGNLQTLTYVNNFEAITRSNLDNLEVSDADV